MLNLNTYGESCKYKKVNILMARANPGQGFSPTVSGFAILEPRMSAPRPDAAAAAATAAAAADTDTPADTSASDGRQPDATLRRDMPPEEFRRWGHALVDWLADYPARVENLPVQSRAQPGELRAALPAAAPELGEDFATILADVDRLIVPGLTHWQAPGFFAYFPANTSGPSILGELLAAGLGVQGMLWATSPACTELETHVLDWLATLSRLPPKFHSSGAGGGVLLDSASSATLCALLAARERATAGAGNRLGAPAHPTLVAYTSDQAHSSVRKAARIAGLGDARLRVLPTDAAFTLPAVTLQRAIEADLAAGLQPFFCSVTIGTTSSMAVDPVAELATLCLAHGIWLHVDAAMAGNIALCEEFQPHFAGLAQADSYTFNPHKWLFTNFDCNCFYVADRAALTGALGILPEYLRTQASSSGAVIDYRDWQVPLGRRFRALKLWFVLRWYGAQQLRALLRDHVAMARWFGAQVQASDQFELLAPVHFSLVCFRHRAGNAFNARLLAQLNADGQIYLSHTVLNDVYVLRLAVGATRTEPRHVEAAWTTIQATAARLQG